MEPDDASLTRKFSGTNMLLGAWLVISPYLLNYTSSAARWTQITFGVFVLLLAAIRFFAPRFEWASWFVGLCGIWLIIAPFLLQFPMTAAYWNEVITGIIIASLAFWNLDTYSERHRHPV